MIARDVRVRQTFPNARYPVAIRWKAAPGEVALS